MTRMWRNLLALAGGVPVLVLLVATYYERWRKRRTGGRVPVQEKLLRPPGFSLGRQIEQLGDRYNDLIFAAFFSSVAAVGGLSGVPAGPIILGVFGMVAASCTVVAWRTLQRLRVLRLGLLGEQTMGELLSRMARQGYRIFHDVPGGGKWNVDHVLVGPGGIFAVETKCRRKRALKPGDKDHEAAFDGTAIRFPRCADEASPAQARRNAKWLSQELTEAVGETVQAKGVVALPGWFVDEEQQEKADWDVWVLAGKRVPDWIEEEPQRLSEGQIRRVAYQLDRRCRDVEL